MFWCFSTWTGTLKYAGKMGPFFSFIVVHPTYLLTKILAWFPVSVITGTVASACGVGSLDECCWAVLLLVLNAGQSGYVADSMLIVVGLFWGNSTRCDRQSAALLHAPNYLLKVMLYVANSSPHLLTLLFAFFPLRNLASGLWSFLAITSAP